MLQIGLFVRADGNDARHHRALLVALPRNLA